MCTEQEHACMKLVRAHSRGSVTDDSVLPLSLHFGQPHIDLYLLLGRQFLLHIRLESTEEERSEHTMKSCDQLGVLQFGLVEP